MKTAPIMKPAVTAAAIALRRVVGHQQREGELEDVVVGGAEELRPEERREAALRQQRELIRVGLCAQRFSSRAASGLCVCARL